MEVIVSRDTSDISRDAHFKFIHKIPFEYKNRDNFSLNSQYKSLAIGLAEIDEKFASYADSDEFLNDVKLLAQRYLANRKCLSGEETITSLHFLTKIFWIHVFFFYRR